VFIPVEYPGPQTVRDGAALSAHGRAGQTFVARKPRANQCLNDPAQAKISAEVECRAEVSPFGGTGDKDTGRLIAAVNGLRGRLLDAAAADARAPRLSELLQ
jgi:hypothetical protein